jgi:hypothetical protein
VPKDRWPGEKPMETFIRLTLVRTFSSQYCEMFSGLFIILLNCDPERPAEN